MTTLITRFHARVVSVDALSVLACSLTLIILTSPLLVVWPGHPYPWVSGPVMHARLAIVGLLGTAMLARWRIPWRSAWPLSAFAVALVLTTLTSADRHLSLWSTPGRMVGVIDQLLWMALALLLPAYVPWRRAFAVVTLVGGIHAALAVAESLINGGRAESAMGNPGYLAVYLMGTVLAAVVLSERRRAWLVLAFLAAYALDLTGTRSALLGLGVGLGVLTVASRRWYIAGVCAALVLFLAALSLSLPLPGGAQTAVSRVASVDAAEGPVTERVTLAGLAWRAFVARPLTGWGPNAYGEAHRELAPEGFPYADYPHNMVLGELAEKGMLALVTYAAWMALVWRLWRASRPFSPLALAILASFPVYGLFWFLSWPMALWLILATGYALKSKEATPKDGLSTAQGRD